MTEATNYTTPDADDVDVDQDDTVTLPGQHMRVHMAGGQSFAVRVTNRERVLWDKTAPKHKWGKADDVPSLATTFTIWGAARREGHYAGTFDAFCDAMEDFDVLSTEDVRPTQ
jgi:hypothetical protein